MNNYLLINFSDFAYSVQARRGIKRSIFLIRTSQSYALVNLITKENQFPVC